MNWSGELLMRPRESVLSIHFLGGEATSGINTKIALERVHKQLVAAMNTLFNFLHDNIDIL